MPIIEGGEIINDPAPADHGALLSGPFLRVARATYDFAADGGAVSAITLLPAATIPDNSIIIGGWLEMETALVGSGASVALHTQAADDLVAAAAISGAPWSSTGRKDILPDMTGSATLKTTAARNITATITAAVLTAGKFNVVIFYAIVD
jgi:hypothetical protein